VLPGLIDMHARVAAGALPPGTGLECCEPDTVGVRSGVTAIVDAGSVGAAHAGAFARSVIPRSATGLLCYLNVGTRAHEAPGQADVRVPGDISPSLVAAVIAENPGLVRGLKLRLVGPGAASTDLTGPGQSFHSLAECMSSSWRWATPSLTSSG
jgi:dihydroorotase